MDGVAVLTRGLDSKEDFLIVLAENSPVGGVLIEQPFYFHVIKESRDCEAGAADAKRAAISNLQR